AGLTLVLPERARSESARSIGAVRITPATHSGDDAMYRTRAMKLCAFDARSKGQAGHPPLCCEVLSE
ncbi:MAG: hypothetical protein ACT4OO_14575, partial [Nitrospiraceae bacterium]